MNTRWDPLDQALCSLSAANLTVSRTAGAGDFGCRAVDPQSHGKYYWEVTAITLAGTDSGVGACTNGASWVDMGGSGRSGAFIYRSGNIWVNASSTGTNPGAPTGHVICISLDLDNSRVWFRIDGGNWNNNGSANPSTNTGGFDISALTGGNLWVPVFTSSDASDTLTANFGDSAFAQTVPAGFTSGWPSNAPVSGSMLDARQTNAGIALSNSNLTASSVGSAADALSRSLGLIQSGKYYFEWFVNRWAGGGASTGIGICNGLANGSGMAANATNGFAVYVHDIWVNGVDQISIGNVLAGEIVGIAIDLTNKLGWIRRTSGNWNGSPTADPATATGGFDISGLGSQLYAAIVADHTDTTSTVALNSSSQTKIRTTIRLCDRVSILAFQLRLAPPQ